MPSCAFLDLPQELRDLIFEFAVVGDDLHVPVDGEDSTPNERRLKQVPISTNNRWEWIAAFRDRAPSTTYLSLMLCNRQLHDEMEEFIVQMQKEHAHPAKMTLLMVFPDFSPVWTQIAQPPDQTTTLEISVKVDHMYHPAYITRGPQSAIMAAVFAVLKRYIYRGPHLARPSPLRQPLNLETVRITLSPPQPFDEMSHIYGFPKQQLETLFNQFRAMMARLSRSGIAYGSINQFELRMEGQDWEHLPVTANVWDEEDFLFLQYGGYQWDASETPVSDPDLMPW